MNNFSLTDKQKLAIKMIIDAPEKYVDENGVERKYKALETLLYGGTRSAKTFLILYVIIVRAIKVKSRHLVARESFTTLDRTILHDTWPKVLELGFPSLVPYVAMRQKPAFATFPNGSEVWFTGLEAGSDKVLGSEFSTAFINEASEVVTYSSYEKIITRVSEKNSLRKQIYVDENPPAKSHWTYSRFILNIDHASREPYAPFITDTFRVMQINPTDNLQYMDEGYLTTIASGGVSARKRFLLGEFQDSVEGGVYTKELNEAQREGRICEVKPHPDYPINVVFDIGWSDYTSIWFCQFLKDRVLLLEYYQNCHMSLPDYLDVIFKDKNYKKIGTMVLPHDSLPNNWSTDRSHYEVAVDYGKRLGFIVKPLHAVLRIQDGIDACRLLFKSMWFDVKKCSDGIDVLRNYRYEFDDGLGMYKDRPVHDKYSHGADALRYVSDAYNGKYVKEIPRAPTNKNGWTVRDIMQEAADKRKRLQQGY